MPVSRGVLPGWRRLGLCDGSPIILFAAPVMEIVGFVSVQIWLKRLAFALDFAFPGPCSLFSPGFYCRSLFRLLILNSCQLG